MCSACQLLSAALFHLQQWQQQTALTFLLWDNGEHTNRKHNYLTCKQSLLTYIHIFFILISDRELKYGIPVTDEEGNRLGESTNAAQKAIVQVVVSRIGMAVPAMGKAYSFSVWLSLCFYWIPTLCLISINLVRKFISGYSEKHHWVFNWIFWIFSLMQLCKDELKFRINTINLLNVIVWISSLGHV